MSNMPEKQINVTVIRIDDGVVGRIRTHYPMSGCAGSDTRDFAACNIGEVFEKLDVILSEDEESYISVDYDPTPRTIYFDEDIAGLNEEGLRQLSDRANLAVNE